MDSQQNKSYNLDNNPHASDSYSDNENRLKSCCCSPRYLWRKLKNPGIEEAKFISILSIIITVVTFVAGLILAIDSHSASTLSYSLESLVDVISSILVLWRFWGHTGDEVRLKLREKRANILIAWSFVVLALVVFSAALTNLIQKQEIEDDDILLGLAIPSVIVLLILGAIKLFIGYKLESPSMSKDGICSVSAAFLSLSIVIGVSITEAHPELWWMDSCLAIIISTAIGIYGTRTLLRVKWWTSQFWHPHLNEDDEETGKRIGIDISKLSKT